MKYLKRFNESSRVESIKSDIEDIFHSEVEMGGFVMTHTESLGGELKFQIKKLATREGDHLVQPFLLNELATFMERLFTYSRVNRFEMSLSCVSTGYRQGSEFYFINQNNLVLRDGEWSYPGEFTTFKLIIRIKPIK